jgi:hypothetical protein
MRPVFARAGGGLGPLPRSRAVALGLAAPDGVARPERVRRSDGLSAVAAGMRTERTGCPANGRAAGFTRSQHRGGTCRPAVELKLPLEYGRTSA